MYILYYIIENLLIIIINITDLFVLSNNIVNILI